MSFGGRIFLTFLIAISSLSAQTAAALFERAVAQQQRGQLAEAEASYRLYCQRFGDRPEVLANWGALLARQERFAEAITLYQRALRANPKLTPLHLNLGLAHFKQNQFAAAISSFDAFLAATPGHPQATQLRAIALLEDGRFAEAEAAYRSLLLADATNPALQLGHATALLRLQRVPEARAILEPLLERNDSPEVQLALSQALFAENRFEEAAAGLAKAEALNPNLPGLRLLQGAVLWKMRKPQEAISSWRLAVSAAPEAFEPVYTLGAALSLQPQPPAEAETLLRKALSLRPNHARANYQLAKLLWQKKKLPDTLLFVKRATAADPELREAFYLQGTVLQASGRAAEAAKSFAQVKRLSEKALAQQQQDIFSEAR